MKKGNSHSHKVARMKTFDEKHKGKGQKVKVTMAALGTPWSLQDPSKLVTIQHK